MSDMDDDELKATRRLNGADKYSEADEMFEKLGYRKIEEINNENDRFIIYRNIHNKNINFAKLIKRIWIDGSYSFLTMQELQAINKKCEELRWL